jgi:hypothetical protein
MEWIVCCGRDLVAAKRVQGITNITYPRPVGGPKFEKLPEPCEPLLFVFLWFTKRPWVTDVVVVLVHGTRDKVQVPRLEPPKPFVDKFDLWGIGLWVSHWDEVVEGAGPEERRQSYIGYLRNFISH